MDFDALVPAARDVIAAAKAKGWTLATVESCTGGLIAACLTAVPGSSAVVERGFVTYANAAKTALVGVPAGLIAAHGAVSEEVARAMAEGALKVSPVDLAVSVTGIAGPDGGSAAKPVGLVWIGLAQRGGATESFEHRFGDVGRDTVRARSVAAALQHLLKRLGA